MMWRQSSKNECTMKWTWKLLETSAVEPDKEMQLNDPRPADTLMPDIP